MSHQGPPEPLTAPGAAAARRLHEPSTGRPHEDLAEQAIKTAPPWLLSAVFHMSLIILLGVLLLPSRPDARIRLEAQTYAEQLGNQLDFESPLPGDDRQEDPSPVVTPEDLVEVDDPFAAPAPLEVFPEGHTLAGSIDAPQIGMALLGRSEGMKRSLRGRYGGTATTEAAVQLGLQWLARNQINSTGAWSLKGPYRDGASIENDSAATAMALLAFLGNGHTHQGKDDYTENVRRGVNWLLNEQDANGNFFHDGGFNHRFYTQAQATIVVCELLAMTRDESLRGPARRAVQYLLDCQSDQGGWKYDPRVNSDVSVTGWVVMALQSARMAGLEVPSDHFRRVSRYLDRVALDDGSHYPYQRGQEGTPAMTAEGLLCRQYLGWARDDKRLIRGVEWLTTPDNLIDYRRNRNVYYWYYAAQVMHHMEGKYWQRWNQVMRQQVPAHQVKQGKEAGSWEPSDRNSYDVNGGRLYVTCLSIYMLEVYYRHLPLYSKVYAR